MKLLGNYENGNYRVSIFDDGTKIKETDELEFIAQFPESMDVKITNYCDRNCLWCHEDSSIEGQHGDILNAEFIQTLRPYTEMAIGGGNPLSHPQLLAFLIQLKEQNIIANITVNQYHFMQNLRLLKDLTRMKLIWGLGVSFQHYCTDFIEAISKFPNAVLHIINGITKLDDIQKMYGKDLKILILGYKQFRRGNDYYSQSIEDIKKQTYDAITDIINGFKVVSFDNLAIAQLEVRRLVTDEQWNEFYMGDDGSHTMYVDLVNRKFALNSTSSTTYNLLETVDDMFSVVKNIKI